MKEKNVIYLEKVHQGSTRKVVSMQKMIISYFCQSTYSQFIIHNPPLVYVHHSSFSIYEASDSSNWFHRFGFDGKYNKKYMTSEGKEVIINTRSGKVDNRLINKGTFNFSQPFTKDDFNPTKAVAHGFVDMLPYFMAGSGYNAAPCFSLSYIPQAKPNYFNHVYKF